MTLALDAIVPGVVAAVAANRRAWQNTDLVVEKPDVIHAVYERIVIEGPRFVGLRLTPAAYRHGLALGLPDAVMARPTGVGRAISTYTLPIEGRDEWLAAARRQA